MGSIKRVKIKWCTPDLIRLGGNKSAADGLFIVPGPCVDGTYADYGCGLGNFATKGCDEGSEATT